MAHWGEGRVLPRPVIAVAVAAALIATVAAIAYALLDRQGFFLEEHPEAARFTERLSRPLPLFERWSSYESVALVTARLDAAGLSWQRRSNARPPSRQYPPRALDTITVEGFQALGGSGRLTLEFFNDRLFEIEFEPADIEACAAAIRRAEPSLQWDKNGRAERVRGNWRISTNVELARSEVGRALASKPYVIWQDLRLVRSRDEWDERFGAIAYPPPAAARRW